MLFQLFLGKSPQTFSPLLPKKRLTERGKPQTKRTAHTSDKHSSSAQYLGRTPPLKDLHSPQVLPAEDGS